MVAGICRLFHVSICGAMRATRKCLRCYPQCPPPSISALSYGNSGLQSSHLPMMNMPRVTKSIGCMVWSMQDSSAAALKLPRQAVAQMRSMFTCTFARRSKRYVPGSLRLAESLMQSGRRSGRLAHGDCAFLSGAPTASFHHAKSGGMPRTLKAH
jgi:hypothetical protein